MDNDLNTNIPEDGDETELQIQSKKRFSVLHLVTAIIISAIVATAVTACTVGVALRDSYGKKLSELQGSEFAQKMDYVRNLAETAFIKDYDPSEAEDKAVAAYLDALGDRYTFYMSVDEMQAYLADSGGSMVGIGIHVVADSDGRGIYITRVMPSSPALDAGLQAGDIICAVDGVEITDENYNECVDMIRGDEGSEVKLTLLREAKKLSVSVKRATVEQETVYYSKLDGDIAHITLTEFIGNTAKQFNSCLEKAREDGCKAYVFDVRNNPGGSLDEVLKVLDTLLPEGDLINIVYADGATKTYGSDAKFLDAKMAVLCNERTASAGELFTSALRDYDAASIIGTTTFGKGTMQNVITLSDGSGIRISVAYYNPPCNISYDGIGITPEYEVKLSEDAASHFYQMTYEEDTQLQKAVEILSK